ncbi:MAG: hypothetical protein ABSB35_22925 [Bryobacteraceae bacterium]|jgi:hypothetical protein
MRVLLIAAVLLTGACSSPTKPAAKQVKVGWRPLGSWTGHGSTQTESFQIESGEVRLRWQTTNEKSPGTGTFVVGVHSAVSGRLLDQAIEFRGVGHDISYVTEDPHWSYLVIDSNNVDWSVEVEEPVISE